MAKREESDRLNRVSHRCQQQTIRTVRMSSEITLTFLGHAAWRIRHEATDILIDPFLTGNPTAAQRMEDFAPTHIILTHGHGDHLGDTVEIASRSGAQVISTFEVANYCASKGCENTIGMGLGGAHQFGFGRLKFTLAHHSSSASDGTYLGNPAGVLLTIDGRTIYHAGDTALFLDMKLIGEMNAIDVALLPIGDYFTMGVEDAAMAVEFLHPKLAIPMHYNTFPLIQVDPHDFVNRVQANGKKGLVMNPGETHSI